jgi:TrmH family RNA methyltransferase
MTITSPHNDQLKEIRKLAGRKWRDKLRQFVAEGEDLLAAADAAGWEPLARLVAEGSGLPGEEVRPHLLAQVSQLGSGTRALGVYGQRWAPAPVGPLCLALWGVNDPGNVGTALRGALAFGAASVALGPGTADPYGPKAVRASMGSIFAKPPARAQLDALDGHKIALDANAERELRDTEVTVPLVIVLGSERGVLPEAIERARIPVFADSLNVAMAASVALYETALRMARDD